MIQSCLTHGLTTLRNARVDTKGHFYTAFFQLSIGFERLMKACVAISHMAHNRFAPPGKSDFKAYGHELASTFEKLKSIAVPKSSHPLETIAASSIEYAILDFLSEFATTTRYFNLDSLSKSTGSTDPLAAWNVIIERIVQDDIAAWRTERILRQSRHLASSLHGLATVIASDLDKNPLDLEGMIHQPRIHDIVSGHAVFHVVCLVRPLTKLLSEITHHALTVAQKQGHKSSPIPYMDEFFHFTLHDRHDILRKRKWP